MDISLKNKTALVGGSTKGIGRATAELLAKLGARVVLLARNEEALKAVCRSLDASQGQQHAYIRADFAQPHELERAVADYLRGGHYVHILVNNTGGPKGGPVYDAQPEEFLSAFSNHLVCNHILAKLTVPSMKKAGYGRIVNIISTSVKQPLKGLGVSNTVRAAVANWAKTLSAELAPFGITVNNVLPGATDTDRLREIIRANAAKQGKPEEETEREMLREIPAGRFASAEELAAAVAFLASPAAGYITGINLPVDGGRTGCL